MSDDKNAKGGSFAPGVWLDGKLHHPPGWMWILGFAIGGCKWAIKEASKDGFREMIIKDLREKRCKELQKMVDDRYKEIDRLREELHITLDNIENERDFNG